jgi:hypothetical protein
MKRIKTLNRALVLTFVCTSIVVMCHHAVAQGGSPTPPSYPLYCQGPLHTSSAATPLTPFKWANTGAGAANPGAGDCAWGDRGPRGSEFQGDHGNVICGGLGPVANLAAGQYMEVGVYRNAGANNCMTVTQVIGFVQPPFSSSPTLPATGPLANCGMDANHNKSPGQPAQVNYVKAYSSNYAMWCVDENYWPANMRYIEPFMTYYDYLISWLPSVFNISLPLPVVFEITWPDGAACDCGPKFGDPASVVITGDAFSNSLANPKTGQNVPGFWGWLLPMHEMVNNLTGQIAGGGWPTDWWADQRSPFPNAMDEQIMSSLGTSRNNQTLQNAAAAQHERFADPSQSGYDSEVAMFDAFFNQYGGFPTLSRFFHLVQNDGLQWVPVAQDPNYTPDNNTSPLLSEYVIAYLSLAFGTRSDLTQTFVTAGVGTLDTNIAAYTISSPAVLAIANAHCSVRAAAAAHANVSVPLAALQKGNYQSAMATGGTKTSCPAECSWTGDKCVARW